jgi:hypothetical protein
VDDDFLKRLEKGYAARCGDTVLRAAAWNELCGHYPPSIGACAIVGEAPPSTIFAREAGDLGTAILWIVQAALVRPIAAETGLNDIQASAPAAIGALAHSEDPAQPMRVSFIEKSLRLSGLKKYITGGLDADFLLLTALEQKSDSLRVIHLPAGLLPDGALEEIDLGMLRTTSHARLSLSDFIVDNGFLLPADDRSVKRTIKRWGMVERALIMEAYIGLCSYLARLPGIAGTVGPDIEERLEGLLDEQAKSRLAQVDAAMTGARIEPGGADFAGIAGVAKHIAIIAGNAGLPPAQMARIDDLDPARLFAARP